MRRNAGRKDSEKKGSCQRLPEERLEDVPDPLPEELQTPLSTLLHEADPAVAAVEKLQNLVLHKLEMTAPLSARSPTAGHPGLGGERGRRREGPLSPETFALRPQFLSCRGGDGGGW